LCFISSTELYPDKTAVENVTADKMPRIKRHGIKRCTRKNATSKINENVRDTGPLLIMLSTCQLDLLIFEVYLPTTEHRIDEQCSQVHIYIVAVFNLSAALFLTI